MTTTGFFEQVYRLARQVPPGMVTSYGAIARMLGQPHAACTVGWALHSIPVAGRVDTAVHLVIMVSVREQQASVR